MIALLLRLAAPMQAWGTQSRFSERDTQLEPSKSGVVGLLASALGRPREADLSDLASLQMAVRVDREGTKQRDYHTVGGGSVPLEFATRHRMKRNRAGGFDYGVSKANASTPDTAVSNRYFLADARFLVALGGEEEGTRSLLLGLAEALRAPTFPLFLGRKSFVPAEPVLYDSANPLREGESLRTILDDEPWQPDEPHQARLLRSNAKAPAPLRLVLESSSPEQGATRSDIPLSFARQRRRFDTRQIVVDFTKVPIERWLSRQAGAKESAL